MKYINEIGSNSTFQVLKSSVAATQLRCGGMPCNCYTDCFLGNLSVKEFWKSIFICRLKVKRIAVLDTVYVEQLLQVYIFMLMEREYISLPVIQ